MNLAKIAHMEYADPLLFLANITRKKCLFIHARFLRIIIYTFQKPHRIKHLVKVDPRFVEDVSGWMAGSHEFINPAVLEYSEDVVVSSTISSW